MGINTKSRILFMIGFKSYDDIAIIENRDKSTIKSFV